MPLRFVDLAPFIPHGFQRVMVEGRRSVARVIMGRQPRLNGDLAIATIHPAPNHHVSFTGIRNILDDFLREHQRVLYRTNSRVLLGRLMLDLTSIMIVIG